MRFAFVAGTAAAAGGRWTVEAAHALAAAGHDIDLIAPATDGAAQLLEAESRSRVIPLRGLNSPLGWFRLRSELAAGRPDVIVALDPQAWRAVDFVRRWKRDRVSYVRVEQSETSSESQLTRDADRLLARDPSAKADPHICPLPIGVRLPEVAPDRILLRRALRLPRRVRLVLQVGDLVPGAGHEVLLRALALVRDRRVAELAAAGEPRATEARRLVATVPTLAFVGTGPEESRLHVLAHDLGVKDHVLWVGFRKEIAPYIGAADSVVIPQATPAALWTLLDAMAHAVPVAAVDSAEHRDRIRDGVTGLLLPHGDAAAWAGALERFQDAAVADALGQAAQKALRFGGSDAALAAELETLVLAIRIERQVAGRPGARPALFVDRDGTLVRNVPYNADPSAVQLEPGVARALRWVRSAGVPVIVVSNQSAVARGLCDVAEVEAVNARMRELLRAAGTDVDAIYYCPHHPDHGPACDCRKPEPGLLRQAAADHGIELERSVTVGDAERDLEAGRRAGTGVVAYVEDESGAGPARGWAFVMRDVLGEMCSRLEAAASRR